MRPQTIIHVVAFSLILCTTAIGEDNPALHAQPADRHVLETTKGIRLIVKITFKSKDTNQRRYEFEKAIQKRVEDGGYNVLSGGDNTSDVTLIAECTQADGSNYGGPFGDSSLALGCKMRLEHRTLGVIWATECWNTSPWPYLWSNSYEAGVQNLEEGELTFKYLSDLIRAKLGRADEIALYTRALKDKAWTIRMESAQKLGELKDLRGVGPLIDTLKDKRPDVVESAASALGALGSSAAVIPLTEVFLKHPQRLTKISAAFALEKIGGREVEVFYESVIEDATLKELHDLARRGIQALRDRKSKETH